MSSGSHAVELSCPSCGGAYRLDAIDPAVAWHCLRCRRPVHGPAGGARRWLYGGRQPSASPPATAGASGGAIAAEATFGGDLASPAAAAPRQERIGRYTIDRELGRGGMGVVYLAWDPDLSRPVGLKLLLAGERAGRDQVERFLREARSAARLDHRHLVRVFDIGRHEDRVYFAMAYVDGPSLHDVVRELGPLPPEEAARIVLEVARGVHAAHQVGLVHRDLKPANVLLEADGTALVTDFGLAKELGEGDSLTMTGQVLGTPAYMAPEQASGGTVDARTDVYAIGAVLYDALAGRSPYGSETAAALLAKVIQDEPDPLSRVAPDVPAPLVAVCAAAMARDPARRYPTAGELADDLQRWLDGDPVLAASPSVVARVLRRWLRRRPLVVGSVATLAAVALAVLSVTAGSRVLAGRAEARREALAAERLARTEERIDGEPARADELVAAFLAADEHRGTRALARGWLLAASRAPEEAAARRALAAAYATATAAEDQARALEALADRLRLAGDEQGAWRAFELLAAIDPARARARHEDRLQSTAAAGDVAGAALLAVGHPIGPALAALLPRAGPERRLGQAPAAADLDGDGREEIVAYRDGRLVVHDAVPGMPESKSHAWTGEDVVDILAVAAGDADGLVVLAADGARRHGQVRWLTWRGPEPVVLAELPLLWSRVAATGDLDLDGVEELYVGLAYADRGVVRIDPGGSVRPASPTLHAVRSDAEGMAVTDLDRDGVSELAVGLSGWSAFDVRVERQGPDGLVFGSRLRMGDTTGLVPIGTPSGPALAVLVSRRSPSAVQFPADRPYGRASGLYEVRLGEDGLALAAEAPLVPAVPGRESLRDARVGDVDGDGWDDVVCRREPMSTVVFRRDPAGGWTSVVLGGVRPHALVELDGDPGLELLGTDGARDVVLGLAGAPPAEPPPAAPTAPFPGRAEDDPVAAVGWDRAGDLVRVGLRAEAAQALLDLPYLDPAVSRAARRRAADLLREAGRIDAAVPLLEALADEGDADAGAAAAAARLARHEYALARDRVTDPALAEELERILGGPAVTLDLRGPLDPRWRVAQPLAAHREATGLRITSPAGLGPVLTMPVRWDGDRLRLRVRVELERTEWASMLSIGLSPASGEVIGDGLGVFVLTSGGGRRFVRRTGCVWPGSWITGGRKEPQPAVDGREVVDVEVDYRASNGETLCRVRGEGGQEEWVEVTDWGRPVPPGELVLQIRADSESMSPVPVALVARVEQIDLDGLTLLPPGPAEPAHALVDGVPLLALDGLPERPTDPGSAWMRVLALDRVHDEAALPAAVRHALATGTPDPVPSLLRWNPRLLDRVRSVDAELALALWLRAWETTLRMHPDDPSLRESLTRDVRQVALPDGLRVLVSRGLAWDALGRPDAARADLDRALAAEPTGEVSRLARVGRARLLLRQGDEAGALADLEAALASTTVPEILLDQWVALPDLAPLALRLGADPPP